MNSFAFPDQTTWNGASPLPHLGVIQALGPDAASFLHGQLSQDTTGLDATTARYAAYCSVKGRMLADALVVRPQPEQVLLVMGADVLPATLKRLSMFVLRAKAKLSDAQGALTVVGLVGPAALNVLGSPLAEPFGVVAQAAPGESEGANQGINAAWAMRLPDVLGAPRALWIGPTADAAALTSGTAPLPEGAWVWLEVMSGVPRIELPTVDQFVPQMVNYELIGGVNFKKGCYPGQEIVARSQYRGTLKRRLFLLHGQSPLQAGAEVFSAEDPGQPAGMIVNAAPVPAAAGSAGAGAAGGAATWSALAELKLQYAQTPLFVGSAEGAPLSVGTLPYAITTLDD